MNHLSLRTEPELVQLRRKAEQYALGRRERLTSAHLLAAIADDTSLASRLLRERQLSAEQLLKAARSSSDDTEDPLTVALDGAREFAARMRSPDPNALHVLVSLLSTKRCAAYRVLDQFGVDVARLRLAAMNLGLGRPVTAPVEAESAPASLRQERLPVGRRLGRAVSVPLMPKPAPIVRRGAGRGVAHAKPEVAAPAPAALPSETGVKPSVVDKRGARRRRPTPAVTADATPDYALDPQRFRVLSSLGRNLSQLAAKGELPVVVGREAEVERILDVLAKQGSNSPCLVGCAGVGKSSVVSALALSMLKPSADSASTPVTPVAWLDDRIVVELAVADLLSGTGIRGSLAERFAELLKELKSAEGRVVLVIEDLPGLFTGDTGGELAGPLRRALAEGDFVCIGTASVEDFQRVIEGDSSLERRFSRIDIEEPDLDVAVRILESRAEALARHHQLQYEPAALRCAVGWSARYITGRALPDKAIALTDLAGARAKRRGLGLVSAAQMAEVVAEASGVPVGRLLETDSEHLLRLEETLAQRVVGHSESLAKIARMIRRNAAGLGASRPVGTLLLLGPSGVGKTETAKALASSLFGTESAMTRVDLSEYSEAHAVARLIGAPPGYVGHEAGGQLTEAVRRRPYQVLLLDEIEKAHVDVLQLFLPLLDEGRLTDGRGRTIDFTNTLIVLTSNLGAREATASGERTLGFGSHSDKPTSPVERVLAIARKALPPEFWNRLDETLVFGALSQAEVREIARRLLQELADRVFEQREVELQIEPDVVDLLIAEGGFDVNLGARPMRRAIARLVEGPLAEQLLSGKVPPGAQLVMDAPNGKLELHIATDPAAAAEE